MKKFAALLLAVLMMLSATACGGNQNAGSSGSSGSSDTSGESSSSNESKELPTINFWTGGSQNVNDVFTSLVAAYNAKEDRAANVELQFVLSGTGGETLSSRLAAAYKTGQTDSGFDMFADNGEAMLNIVDEAGSEDVFLDLDFSKLSNYDLVQMKPSLMESKLLPYRGTTVVLAYDSAKVPNPPATWEELRQWIKDNDGRFAYNTPDSGGAGSAFVYNAIYRLIDDPNARMTNDPKYAEMWDAGFDWLKDIHPYIYKSGGHVQYPVKNQGALDLLASGEIWITPAWADGTLSSLEAGTLPSTVQMYQLSDGALTGTDVVLTIPSIGSNVDACYDFMDFIISVEGQQILVDQMKAIPVIDSSLLEQTDSVAAVSKLNPAEFQFMSIGALGTQIKERWTAEIATLG